MLWEIVRFQIISVHYAPMEFVPSPGLQPCLICSKFSFWDHGNQGPGGRKSVSWRRRNQTKKICFLSRSFLNPAKSSLLSIDVTRYVRFLKLSGILKQDMPKEKSSSRWNRTITPSV